ncbi:MAG TPA: hypothetical protein VKU90_07090 [Caulobacteraceae bacterium]|nr:hypothetical protein [Caulobacteraceae bacterium]
MRTKVLAAVGALALVGAGWGVGFAQGNQPHMQNALAALQTARGELQIAERDKGGHRAAALNLVNQAITQVQAGIAVGAGM